MNHLKTGFFQFYTIINVTFGFETKHEDEVAIF